MENLDSSNAPFLDDLKSWNCDEAGQLAPIGFINTFELGKRFKRKYSRHLDLSSLQVYSSETERVVDSAKMFLNATGQHNSSINVLPKNIDFDLNPIYSCKAYSESNPSQIAKVQSKLWQRQYISETATRFSKILGLKLDERQASSILDLCAAQISLKNFGRNEGICFLLNDRDFQNYGILDSIEKYYALGYGIDFNEHLGCSLLTSFARELQSNSSQVILRFGHAETIIPFYVAMKMFRDKGLLSGAMPFDELIASNFRPGCFSPFEANMVLESYDCAGEPKIRMLMNESPIPIECSTGSDHMCIKQDFLDLLKRNGAGCQFDRLCKN
jgi:hypothetical protein